MNNESRIDKLEAEIQRQQVALRFLLNEMRLIPGFSGSACDLVERILSHEGE